MKFKMIIKEIKLHERLFFGDEVVVITDKNKFSFKAEWTDDFVKKLNSKVSNFKIESGVDFQTLKEELNFMGENEYFIFERAIAMNINSLWSYFNPTPVQVPRPMSVVLEKNKGIKKFVVFSLNAKNFLGALEANRHVSDSLRKQLKNFDSMKEEDLLMAIKEAIDKEHEIIDFELRIGVVFGNHENGKYVYSDRTLNDEEQHKFISKLIDRYSVVYVENPFSEGNPFYKKLANNYRKSCLICMNPSNGYGVKIDKKEFNTVFAKFSNLVNFKNDVDYWKDNRFNVIVDCNLDAMDAAVGLGIPLVRLFDNKNGEDVARKLVNVSEDVINSRMKSNRK